MLLEYFLLSMGLSASLEWLPSVSWSTWPYVEPQANFAVYLNEAIQLAYLVPNMSPDVISNYCVGILWTIPVQHYFSYITLLAAVLVRDIRRPWKRMGLYTLAIVAGWYASSWSACHWTGLLIADLDITYDWLKWTRARWWALYPVLSLTAGLCLATPLVLLFNSDIFDYPFMAAENAIHPDPVTGLPLM
jgi:hypothetical protein